MCYFLLNPPFGSEKENLGTDVGSHTKIHLFPLQEKGRDVRIKVSKCDLTEIRKLNFLCILANLRLKFLLGFPGREIKFFVLQEV